MNPPIHRARCVLVFAVFAACGDSGSIGRTPPYLAASADKIDFGERTVGTDEERTIYLINKGQTPLELEIPSGDTLNGIFAVLLDEFTVAGEQDTVARVRFEPADPVSYETVLHVRNNSSNQPELSIQVLGVGIERDPCDGVDCSAAPAPSCVSESTSRHYEPLGVCNAGHCEHQYQDDVCERGCDVTSGVCRRDPCEGLACNTPPSPCFFAQGACRDGACQYEPNNAGVCSDSSPCTQNDRCAEGNCVGDPIVCSTPPDPLCVDSTTREVANPQGVCNPATGGCEYAVQRQFCEFGCLPQGCDGDPCMGVDCNMPPATQCFSQTGVCELGVCSYELVAGPCDDGDPCSLNDACRIGSCVGQPTICNSPPPPDCAAPDTRRVYDTSGVCTNGACEYGATTVACNDSNACTAGDYCSAGACHSGSGVNCDDGNPCTSDSCDPGAGCRHTAISGGSCVSPSGACPTGTCSSGTCVPVPNVTCVATYQADLCNDVEVAGICAASGDCVVSQTPPEFYCPWCYGICLQCYFIQLCIPF